MNTGFLCEYIKGLSADHTKLRRTGMLTYLICEGSVIYFCGMTVKPAAHSLVPGGFEQLHALSVIVTEAIALRAGVKDEKASVAIHIKRNQD